MNILFITRLYSGFEKSVSKKVWKPEGVPTIYRLLNELDRSHNLSIVLTAKDSGHTYVSNWSEKNDKNLKLRGIRADVKILTGISYFPSFFPRRFAMVVRDIRQLLCSIKNVYSNNPDLIYCDSANITIAYSLSLLFPNTPIVVRVLGACSFLRSIANSKGIVHRIYRLSFKGRFSAVIGTQDGSGVEYWLDRILNKNVPRYTLLNGVDFPNSKKKPNGYLSVEKKSKAKEKIVILFVGRLEEYKGIRIFVEAVIQSIKTSKKNIHAIVVGNGSLYEEVVELCLSYGCSENFSFTKNVPHEEILDFHATSDIYVSANQDGNLSNSNLEAISSNDCMIIPYPRSDEFIDIKTSSLLGDSVLRYKVNNANDLKNKILSLVDNPQLIKKMERKVSQKKITFLKTWDKRVKEEIDILKGNHRNKKEELHSITNSILKKNCIKNKITVLYIDIEGGFGGSSRSLFNMVSSLDLEKFKPIVFCKKRGPTYEKLVRKGINCQIEPTITSIIPLKKSNLKNWFVHCYKLFFMGDLLKKILKLNPDILHLNYEGLVPLHYLLYKKNFTAKTVLHFRSSLAPANFIYKFYARHINKSINYMIFIVEQNRDIAKRAGVKLEKMNNMILYNPANKISKSIKKCENSNDVLKVIFLARLDENKGPNRLIEIAAILKSFNSKVKIDAFGSSPKNKKWYFGNSNTLKKLRKAVYDQNLSNWIEFHGHTYTPEEMLSKSDLLIHPSKSNDPWGRNIIEALSMGVPVISHGTYDKFVKNNTNGLLFQEWNATKYAETLNDLSEDRETIKKWALNATKLAQRKFEIERYGKKIMSVYTKLLKTPVT